MASVLRRTEDLQRIKTRELVFQYTDGSYPGLYRVAVIDTTLGRVGWAPATIDMSGNMMVPGDLDVSGTLSVGSTAYFESDVDIAGSLLVSNLDTCGLSASQGRFTVDCSTGYIAIQPNLGTAPGATISYRDSRIDMIGCDVSGGNQYKYRTFIQRRPDSDLPETRLMMTDSDNAAVAPIIQFDASNQQLNVLNNLETPLFTVDNNTGNVGINTVTPGQALDVSGRIGINGRAMFSSGINNTIDTDIPYLTIRSGAANVIRPGVLTMVDGNMLVHQNYYGLEIKPESGCVVMNAFRDNGGGGTVHPFLGNHIALQMDASSGNVGIKTNVPQATLDVNGTFAISSLPPASSTAAGVTGQITWGVDGGTTYLYVCQAGSSWARGAVVGRAARLPPKHQPHLR